MAVISRINPIVEALQSDPKSIQRIFVEKAPLKGRREDVVRLAKNRGVPVSLVPRPVLDRMEQGHQGIIARIVLKSFSTLEDILAGASRPFLLLLDEITDPQNFGALIRTAECAGVDGIIVPERRSSGLTEVVYRVSAGAAQHVPIAPVKNLARTMDELKKAGIWLVGAESGGDNEWDEFDFTLPTGIVLGSEGRGLRPLVRRSCDAVLSLPLAGRVNSLNVAAAAAVFLYEVVRQRKKIPAD
ncbi:MAG: 23S rRNA (guanosine(2251)-2'-O)-methyltransferase RlmB [Acidobacteria bacterium]|nr:23S rRNA (guanosine(2251)-2'-O)-methyltransferase RlmB [Acidobacteriota bacterium]